MIYRNILLLDDDPRILRTLKLQLSMHKYNVFCANNCKEALSILSKNDIHVVISDQRMPDITGSEFLSIVKAKHPNTIRIILSGYADFEAVSSAINHGAIYKFINKPWYQETLIKIVKDAFAVYKENINKDSADKIFTQSVEAIIITDKDGGVERLNTSFSLFFEKNEYEVRKQQFKISNLIDDKTIVREINEQLFKDGYWHGHLNIKNQSNVINTYNTNISLIKDDNDCPQKIVYTFYQLQNCAVLNCMEPLKPKGLLVDLEVFKRQIELRALDAENIEHKFAVLKLTFTNLQVIRNIHGLGTIKKIFESSAKSIKDAIVNTNIICHDNYNCLYVLIDKNEADVCLSDTKDTLFDIFNDAIYVNCDRYFLSVKMCSAIFPSDAKSLNELMNVIAEKDSELDDSLGDDNFSIDDVEASLFANNFNVLYNPIADTTNHQQQCFQVRFVWCHPKYNMLEENYYINKISNVETCLEIMQIQLERFVHDAEQILQLSNDIEFYIPLNGCLIQNNDYVSMILDSKLSDRALARHVHFILPEELLAKKSQDIEAVICNLNEYGFKIVIDNFGSTYASLNLLSQIDVKAVILNQYLASSWVHEHKSHVLVKSIITACNNFSTNCILPLDGIKQGALSHLLEDGILYKNISLGSISKDDIVNNITVQNKKHAN